MTTLELFPENIEEMQLDISFISALMAVENSIKAGRTQGGLWFPHPSPEGGNDTLGYGHKLTNKEVETGQIVVSDGTVINYKDGLTDNFVYALFVSDLVKHREFTAKQWNSFYNADASYDYPYFEELPRKYQHVLTNIVYNAGTLVNSRGKWGWPKLAKAIVDGDDKEVRKQMVTHYVDSRGVRHALTKRATKIADAVGLEQ